MDRTLAIQTEGLCKSFGNKLAVRDLTLKIERGEVFGFLGPNGAGKTTSVKMLLGLVKPSAGAISLLGFPGGDPRSRARVGFLPEHFRFHDWLNADEFLLFHADLYAVPRELSKNRIPQLLELVGLEEHRKKKLRHFSKGMLQRIGLAQALLSEPELVILDEPTSGLDPVGRILVRDIIREMSHKGTTVFINSHLLSEIEVTCHRVAFIKNGEVVRTNAMAELEKGDLTVSVRVKSLNPEILLALDEQCSFVRFDGEQLSLRLQNESELPKINRFLVEHGVEVYSIQPEKVSLEKIFVEVVGKDGGL